ncbi:glutamate receptor ionotropic, kainate 3-like [Pararge aegeria]|uniref:glutamate receptor ionotropic, kainate 3-like n=1 Tax=Pararge aegeria TaxID=116150 RepID=UPI0019D1449E|nr:glutamate receptor ionotropic, kainate 3-like [Pararge aegeria]
MTGRLARLTPVPATLRRHERTRSARAMKIEQMRARALLLLAPLLLAGAAAAGAAPLRVGVVGAAPENELLLAAAVRAALGGRAGGAGAHAEPGEPLAAPGRVCAQAAAGAAASVGGARGAAAAARAGLALLLAERAARDAGALQLWPAPGAAAEALGALLAAKGWRGAVLLHAGSAAAAPRLAPQLERMALRARRLPPPHDDDALRNLLLVLKRWGATRFVVWCDAACAVRVLDAAQRAGLLGARHSFLLAALDLHTHPLASYSYGGANVTGLRLFDPDAPAVRRATRAWAAEYAALVAPADAGAALRRVAAGPPTALLLAYDAARVTARAAARLRLPAMPPGDCARGAAAFHADSLLNYVRSEEWRGATGALSWAAGGARRGVTLHAAELRRGGALAAAAQWSARAGLTWRAREPAAPPPGDAMANRTFAVLIAQSDPYVMQQQSAERLAGNARYEGFCVELIEQLARRLGFNYTFVEQPDGDYGTLDRASGQWSGMMRRLIDDENIHFAITDLTITAEREEAVDFTTPFMNLGISILLRKPTKPEPALLAFLLPFSNGVWLCLGLAYLGTSLVLFVVGRLCPEEWQNPYPCIEEPPALENQFTLANALWFNLGAVLQQGSEIAPAAYGSRAVASVWWLFALVITSSYTANLATLLSTETASELIKDVQDLADNDQGIQYGAKAGGATYKFFEQSTNELYQRMYQTMKEQPMPLSNPEGIRKALEDNFAYFAESTTIEYTVERLCDVTSVGDPLDSKGYGIAMKKNSSYRHALNLALLALQEDGVLRDMKRRWWKEMHGGGACQEPDERDAQKLSIFNFLGLFLVLAVGCALGVLLAAADLARAAWQRPRARSFGASLLAELRFVFRFAQASKPARGPLSPPRAPAAPPAPASPRPAGARRRSSMHTASVRLARHAASPRRQLSSPRHS